MIAQHVVQLRGRRVAGGRPDPDPLGAILRRMKYLAVESVGMGFRGASHVRGRQPNWMKRAADVRLLGLSKGADETTLLHFQAPRFGEAAEEVYQQGVLFGARPEPTDTAFDVLGDIIADIASRVRDSERFDTGILERLDGFRQPIFDRGVDEIVLSGDRLPTDRLPRIDRAIADVAASLHEETPVPIRARITGRLDMIRASDKVFSLVLKDGQKMRGIWLGQSIKPLGEHLDQDVVANGTVTFRPSGSVLRLDAEALSPATSADELFSKLPSPGAKILRRRLLHQPQSTAAGMRSVFGKWPGDESDDETLRTLEEVE